MADAEARRAAIQKASVQIRTGSAFVRRAQPQTVASQSTKQPSPRPPDRKRG
jgi:hypothetical protein